jgi:arylsulfatase A
LDCKEIICTTDLFRTFASITGYKVGENEGEDSYDLTPLFTHPSPENPLREATVHHSINGSFAIRQGFWKLIMCPGSGGWSYPTPKEVKDMKDLPAIQLYKLSDDVGESNNLAAENPEKVLELKTLLTQYIRNGRSTPGSVQTNDSINFDWHQVRFTE